MNSNNSLMGIVYQMKRKCAEVDQRLMDELGLSQSELLFFSSLNNCQGISSPELARTMGLSASRVSRVVDKLVINGYLDRNIDVSDRRAITLCLTPKGKVVQNKIESVRMECESRLLNVLPETEIVQFRSIVTKIVENM